MPDIYTLEIPNSVDITKNIKKYDYIFIKFVYDSVFAPDGVK